MTIERRIALWMLLCAPLILVALGTLAFVAEWALTGQPPRIRQIVLAQSGWVVCAALAPVVFAASRRWPFTEGRIALRAPLHLLFAMAYWLVAGFIFQGLLPALLSLPDALPGSMPAGTVGIFQRTFRWFVTSLPFGPIIYFSIVGVEHAIRHFGQTRERDIQMAQLEARLTRARLAALQSQVNPHFLFNALNTIAVRAREGDGTGTARIAEQLSEILRRTLSREQSHEVTLAEEIEVVQQYLDIEQARFTDRLRATFDVDDAVLGAAVPTLAVQHLAENAVRHGIARSLEGGRVAIAARRDGAVLEVRVTDDGAGIPPHAERKEAAGGGIANTRERLHSLYGVHASLIVASNGPGGTIATLRVPYRELSVALSDA
ncbi:MAG TPA: histidine kinase [Gemmatimonadaceae bacterium]|nr:histidine kinase [Gemmatimonadaceae bacterium]